VGTASITLPFYLTPEHTKKEVVVVCNCKGGWLLHCGLHTLRDDAFLLCNTFGTVHSDHLVQRTGRFAPDGASRPHDHYAANWVNVVEWIETPPQLPACPPQHGTAGHCQGGTPIPSVRKVPSIPFGFAFASSVCPAGAPCGVFSTPKMSSDTALGGFDRWMARHDPL